jgi:1,4-dihydroxy-2-naphthoate octaprenyltransferase
MQEIVPLAAGVVIAFLVQRFGTTARSKMLALLFASVVIGAIASFVSGELFESWVFLAIDTGLVLLSAGLTLAGLALWQRRSEVVRQ